MNANQYYWNIKHICVMIDFLNFEIQLCGISSLKVRLFHVDFIFTHLLLECMGV